MGGPLTKAGGPSQRSGWPTTIPAGYRVLRRVAVGGMAEIFEVEPTGGGPTLACKVLLPGADAAVAKLFEREALALAGLSSPRIVGFVDSGPDYLLVDFIQGCDLGALNAYFRRRGKRLPASAILHLAHDIVEGLQALHSAGIIHRDLNPRNVMVDATGHARLIDLGIAKRPGLGESTVGGLKGTLAFMAPEQLAGEAVDGRTDLYAFGLMLYGMATGRTLADPKATLSELLAIRAVEPRPPSDFGAVVDVDAVVRSTLAPDPGQRFSDASTLLGHLPPRPAEAERSPIVEAVMQVRSRQVAPGIRDGTVVSHATGVAGLSSAGEAPSQASDGATGPGRMLAAGAILVGLLVGVGVLGWSMGKSSVEAGASAGGSGNGQLWTGADRRGRAGRAGRTGQAGRAGKRGSRGPIRVLIAAETAPDAAGNVRRAPTAVVVDGVRHELPATVLAKPGVTRVMLEAPVAADSQTSKGMRLRVRGRDITLVVREGIQCGTLRRQLLVAGKSTSCESGKVHFTVTRLRSRTGRR